MKASKLFADALIHQGYLPDVTRIVVDLYGSLSLTGKGHHTDIAIIMGLAGNQPEDVDIDAIPAFMKEVAAQGRLPMDQGRHSVEFFGTSVFNKYNLALHENGIRLTALAGEQILYSKTYYSIGGGFIIDEEHFGEQNQSDSRITVPYPFRSATDLLRHCKESGLSLSGIVMQNELQLHSKADIDAHFANVWRVMQGSNVAAKQKGYYLAP